MKIRVLSILILISLILTSCSMTFEKRHYRKGYYVNTIANKSYKSSENSDESNSTIKENRSEKVVMIKEYLPEVKLNKPDVILNNSKYDKVENSCRNVNLPKLSSADCDVITLKNGEEIEALITKISDTEIEYKKCNNKEGPSYILKSSEILLIKLKNGENYIPKETTTANTNNSSKTSGDSPVTNILSISFAVLGFLLMLLGWFVPGSYLGILFLFIFGLLLGITAIVLGAKGQKKKQKGLGLAGLILGILVTIASLVGLILVLILIF